MTLAITAHHIMGTASTILHHPAAPQAQIAAQGTTAVAAATHAHTTLLIILPTPAIIILLALHITTTATIAHLLDTAIKIPPAATLALIAVPGTTAAAAAVRAYIALLLLILALMILHVLHYMEAAIIAPPLDIANIHHLQLLHMMEACGSHL